MCRECALSLLAAAAAACGSEVEVDELVGASESPVYYGDNNPTPGADTTNDVSGGAASVGLLDMDDGAFCSAVAISPGAIVSARHCFCPDPPGITSSPESFTLPQAGGWTVGIANTRTLSGSAGSHDFEFCGYADQISPLDIVVVILAAPIPSNVLSASEFPEVYLGPNLFARADDFFQRRFYQVGFGGTEDFFSSEGFGTRRRGYVTESLTGYNGEYGDGEFSLTGAIDGWVIRAPADGEGTVHSSHAPGDNGGGLFLQEVDPGTGDLTGPPILVGINTARYDGGEFFTYQYWTPTGSRAIHGPDEQTARVSKLILEVLAGDGDTVEDDVDNCPSAACATPSDCFNPQQEDADGDGIGDVCDVCSDITDTGDDFDQDGKPDACDLCPVCPNCDDSDADGDDVGDGCDNCATHNPFPDNCLLLEGGCPGLTGKAEDFCIFGIGPTGAAFAHCAYQLDADDDGFGDSCDSCPTNPRNGNLGFFANSNVSAEEKFVVVTRDDVCEDVPQFTAKPNVLAFEEALQDCDGAPCLDSVEFSAKAGIGYAFPPGPSFTELPFDAPVGFRHCDCFVGAFGTLLERQLCIEQKCTVKERSYEMVSSNYKRVTIATDKCVGNQPCAMGFFGSNVYPPDVEAPTFAKRTFTSNITTDTKVHPDDQLEGDAEFESARIGSSETIAWRWRADIDAGNIVGHPIEHPFSPVGTVGIFETVALPTTDDASPRDAGLTPESRHQLRRTHTYLTTPLMGDPPNFGAVTLPEVFPCGFLPCGLLVRSDLPVINPDPFTDLFRTPQRIFEQGGEFLMAGSAGEPVYDVSTALSPLVRGMLLDGAKWLVPVERGTRARTLGSETLFVAMPNLWTTSGRIVEVRLENGVFEGIDTRTVSARGEGTLGPAALDLAEPQPDATGTTVMPRSRSDAKGLLSLERRSVFMIGGLPEGSANTGEVWRYDLDARTWHEEIFDFPNVEHVLAAAYDTSRDGILVLDEADPLGAPFHKLEARLIWLDLRSHRATLLGSWPRAQAFSTFTLVARHDGSFVLAAAQANGHQVKAYRFAVTADTHMVWEGHATFAGTLADDAALSDAGVVIPTIVAGKQRMLVLGNASFQPSSSAPSKF